MPKQMSEKTFSYLLDYYIACLEQEDLLSVTFNVSSENSLFLSTLFQTEVLFHTNNTQVEIKNTEGLKKFFQTSLLRQKNKTLFYGYPVILGPQGTISPLFFIKLQHEQKDDVLLISRDTDEYTLNHHILSQHNFSTEEIKNIQHELEGNTILTSLESICRMLQFPYTECTTLLDQKPFKRTIIQKLVNKAILYFGEQTNISANLIAELIQLKKKPLDDLASTALHLLLTSEYRPEKPNISNKPILEIFPLNPAQKNAIQKSLYDSLTVITGPPGTGKSQVVLNIIANAVYQNKTVLFASKNNKAVDVVVEKLNATLHYKLPVRMGHKAHRRNAKEELEHLQKQLNQKITMHEKTITDLQTITSQIEHIQNQIFNLSKLNESVDTIQGTLDILRTKHPDNLSVFDQHLRLDNIDPLLLQIDLRKYFHSYTILKRINKKRFERKQNDCFRSYYEPLQPMLKTYLQNMIINTQMSRNNALQLILAWKNEELALDEIRQLKMNLFMIPPFAELNSKRITLQKKYITLSQTLVQHHWINKFVCAKEIDKQHVQRYFSSSEQLESGCRDEIIFRQLQNQRLLSLQKILSFLPVWVVTNLSAKQSFPLKNNLFDILIIDEASQCDIASALPLFYRAKHIVIIGDPFQLKHISLLTENQDRSLANAHHLPENDYTHFSYTKHSLYDLAEQIIQTHQDKPLLLNEHYRCHTDIISFSNEYYYEQKLMIATDETRLLYHPSFHIRILWHHIKGKTIHTKSPYNEEEAERVVEEILKINEIATSVKASIGIVTLFRAQSEMIAEKLDRFQELIETDITIGTAHRFQGDEKDIIVFSPAVSEGIKSGTLHWIQTTNQLLNVAVTRARSLFIIIGDQEVCRQTTGPLRNLSDYVESRNASLTQLESPIKKMFYEEAKKNDITIYPNYLVKAKKPYNVDFAYFVNGNRYVIEILKTNSKINRQQLQTDGWKIRQFSEQDIAHNLPEIMEELKRLC
jgi:hypothetical protein